MRPFEIGLVLPMGDVFADDPAARWVDIRALALRAEEIGFDVVWTVDELLWLGRIAIRRGSGNAWP
jgi:alkanesulfonate monooxygenase SsuD/methylene tetrahydromethanopterin reductase-like flavin-dependent oxidoreductase (luciferase family)